MSASSHYEITVSRLKEKTPYGPRYECLFNTGDSLQSPYQAKPAFEELKKRFPAPEFKVTCLHWECIGHETEKFPT